MSGSNPGQPEPGQPDASFALILALRWPVALVVAVTIAATSLGRILQRPIQIELVVAKPLPVTAQVDVGRIRTPLVVDRIQAGIKINPIQTAPIAATVKIADSVRMASPVAVALSPLQKAVPVEVKGPVAAKVGGVVNARVAGDVEARVSGDVSADLRGKVEADIAGKVDASVTQPLEHRRIRIGL
jgi:hypothetical protein